MTETTTAKHTYAGRRTRTSGKIGYAYRNEEGTLVYSRRPLCPSDIGSIIQITRPEDKPDSYYTIGDQGPRVVDFTYTDEDVLLGWREADRAAYQAMADADAAKRAARADALESHIGALTIAAAKLNISERTAFARYISDRLRAW